MNTGVTVLNLQPKIDTWQTQPKASVFFSPRKHVQGCCLQISTAILFPWVCKSSLIFNYGNWSKELHLSVVCRFLHNKCFLCYFSPYSRLIIIKPAEHLAKFPFSLKQWRWAEIKEEKKKAYWKSPYTHLFQVLKKQLRNQVTFLWPLQPITSNPGQQHHLWQQTFIMLTASSCICM